MIDTEALRKKVIDLAIQGKLTEQLPSDGDAETLYVQIQEEKNTILDKRGGRKDKSIKENDEEKPFEIPSNWKWIRFGEVGLFKKGPFGSALTKSMFVPISENAVKVYEQQHAIKKDASLGTYYISREYFESDMKGFEVKGGDILVSCAGTIGETYIMPKEIEQGIINQALMRVTLVDSISNKFFLYYFDSNLKTSARNESNGMAIKNIPPFDVMKNWFFPLPPIAEQKRIVNKIEEILALIDIIDDLQAKYSNDLAVLKSKIIDAGIQGKLTEQLPEDGDAEDLYVQILNQKSLLIKEGKIKKEKPLPDITEDEIPFEIPKNWKWVHFNGIGVSSLGKTLNKSTDKGEECRYLCSINVQWEGINLNTVKTAKFDQSDKEKYRLQRGDLLICEGGDSGRCAIWDSDEEMYYQNALHRVRFFGDINPTFYGYVMEAYKKGGIISNYTTGIGIQHLVQASLNSIWLPLPPVSEQERIVTKVESILEQLYF